MVRRNSTMRRLRRCLEFATGSWLVWQAFSRSSVIPAWASQRAHSHKSSQQQHWTLSKLTDQAEQHGPRKTLELNGVTVMPELFDAAHLSEILQAFRSFRKSDQLADFKFGDLRAGRQAVHLPFEPPFDGLPLLGRAKALLSPVSEYLGPDFVLESALVITVEGGTSTMNAHTDTEDEGSLSVHVPLQALASDFAPLSFCPGTHFDVELLDRAGAEVRRWRCIGESSMDARKRISAGQHVQRQSLYLRWEGDASELLHGIDLQIGRTCARVRGIRGSTTFGLQLRDEITHVNELPFVSWLRIQADVEEMQSRLTLHVLRPPCVNTLSTPPNLLIGAPLNVGDAMLYDSRIIHWGMANEKPEARHVLYLNFMSAGFDGYSPDGDAIESASRKCLQARAAFRKQLQDIKS